MLQSMREGAQSTAIKVLIFFIVLSFAGFGIESLLPGGSGTSVAEVNGTEISPQELQLAIDNRKRELAQILGDNLDPAMLEDDRLRVGALNGLIERELLAQEVARLELVASDRAIGQVVASIDAFRVDGRFDPDQYKVVLANAGMTPERFRRSQASDIALTQLQDGVMATDFTTALELEAAAVATAEERDVRYLLLDREQLTGRIQITEDQVRSYYDSNSDEFVSEERVIADFIEIGLEDFLAPVDEDLVLEQLELARSEYRVSDQTSVSHILLMQGDEESTEEYAARIGAVEAQLAAGEDFAALAASASDDIGSAASGGFLGFTDGTAFPEAMEEAIAALDVGQISGAVETEAGTHFIRVEERVAGELPDAGILRGEIEDSIQQSQAQKELLSAVEVLRDLSFNAPDLAGPAEAIGVEVRRSEPVSRSEGGDIFASAQLREALFAEDVLAIGNNSEILELPGNRFAVVRVAEKIAPEQLAFTEVASDIRTQLESEALEQELEQLLSDVRERIAGGDSLESIAASEGWEWRVELGARRQGGLLPREIASKAFAMAPSGESALGYASLPGQQYAIIELARVRAGSIDRLSEAERAALTQQLATLQGQMSLLEFRQSLRQNAEIVTR